MPERVGFIGLGIMGWRMAASLARAGFELTVYNRTREKADRWVAEHGGAVASSPAELAERSDVIVTMVVDGSQVERVLLGEGGAMEGAREDQLVIDCSTIGPTAAREIAARLAERGVHFLDAPVTGSSPKAEDGTLTIMVGGAPDDFERARPVFAAMGELIVHAGPLGQGQMVKLINNAVAAANAATLAEGLVAGRATGVDLDALVEVMAAGAGGSAMLDLKAGPMRAHDYTTLFKLEHMLKDVRLCLEETQAAGTPFAGAAHAHQLLTAGMGRGLGDADFAALLEAVEGLAGKRL
ncbi:MAG: 6-phosphogluconate dehydrogenase NAD-binding protein [Solirubrobacterales bacterium]|nr:6-phosphogluconate dehydrogenase NAD-binding protein [Solirubrobacterales bacterium]